MKTVSIARCNSYNYKEVEKAVFECLDGIKEIKDIIRPQWRVLVKANLLMKKSPEEAVTTHPAVIEAIVRYLQGIGCKVVIGDSPGGIFNEKTLDVIYKMTGMKGVAERTGCELNYDTSFVEVTNDKARKLKNMQVIKVVTEVDAVVSAAKLKTHGMMTYTGAVKNLFGVIPGLTKADYHLKMNNVDNFAEHLLDICEYVKPVFSIIDGIEGMEGNGPSSGDKREVGLIMSSTCPYVLDTAASEIIGLNPYRVPTIKAAKERGLFSGKQEDIDFIGIKFEDINIPPFKLPNSHSINFVSGNVPEFIEKIVLNSFRPKPVFDYDMCISCGDCKRCCPPGVIDMSSGKPIPDLEKCIRCFCCHELCPKKAIDIKKSRHYDKILESMFYVYEAIRSFKKRVKSLKNK